MAVQAARVYFPVELDLRWHGLILGLRPGVELKRQCQARDDGRPCSCDKMSESCR